MVQVWSRSFLTLETFEHQHRQPGKAMKFASLQLRQKSSRMRQIPVAQPRAGGWTRQLPEIPSSSMISWHLRASNVCFQYYSPNSANLWVGAHHDTTQIHFWNCKTSSHKCCHNLLFLTMLVSQTSVNVEATNIHIPKPPCSSTILHIGKTTFKGRSLDR